MATNKVVFGGNTLIDLTADTVSPQSLLRGVTAHDASGAAVVGTYDGGGWNVNRVQFFDRAGVTLLEKEYLEPGWDARYEYADASGWSVTPGGNEVPNITKNITTNLDLYRCLGLHADFSSPIYQQCGAGTAGIDYTYTAPTDQDLLVFNIEVVGSAGYTHRSGAQITTTGLLAWSDIHTEDYYNFETRDCDVVVSLISLSAGQTVTLTNSHSDSYASQLHMIFDVTHKDAMSDVLFETVVDRVKDNSINFTPTEDGSYILFALQTAPAGGGPNASINGATADSLCTVSDPKLMAAIGQYQLTTSDTVTLSTNSISNYVSKVYMIWKIRGE